MVRMCGLRGVLRFKEGNFIAVCLVWVKCPGEKGRSPNNGLLNGDYRVEALGYFGRLLAPSGLCAAVKNYSGQS